MCQANCKDELLEIAFYRSVHQWWVEDGRLTWKDISLDNIHPNNMGHAIIGKMMWNFFNSVYLKMDTIYKGVELVIKDALASEAYANATIMDSETIEPI